jgi:predicted RNA-binding Zn-ribbon protein involved in translation (DUF1610 family)
MKKYNKMDSIPLEEVLLAVGLTEAEKCKTCGHYLDEKQEYRGNGFFETVWYCPQCGDTYVGK